MHEIDSYSELPTAVKDEQPIDSLCSECLSWLVFEDPADSHFDAFQVTSYAPSWPTHSICSVCGWYASSQDDHPVTDVAVTFLTIR